MFCVNLSDSDPRIIDIDTIHGKPCRRLFHKSFSAIRSRVERYGIIYHTPNYLFFNDPDQLKEKIVVDPICVSYLINGIPVVNARHMDAVIKKHHPRIPKTFSEWLITVAYCDPHHSHTVEIKGLPFVIQVVLPESLRGRNVMISGSDRGCRYTVFMENGYIHEDLTRRDLVKLLHNQHRGSFDPVARLFNSLYANQYWSDDTTMVTLDNINK